MRYFGWTPMPHANDLDVVQERFLAGLKGMAPAGDVTAPTDGEFSVAEVAGQYCVRSQFHRVQFTFDRLADSRGGVHGELQVSADWKDELLGVTDISLKS